VNMTGGPIEVEQLAKLNERGNDDLFICCASFEERCLSSLSKLDKNYRANFGIIFVIEEPANQKQVNHNLYRIQSELSTRASKGIFVISSQRDQPMDGINQLKKVWQHCQPKNPEQPFITLDISGFTKIYLLEILRYLIVEQNLSIPRLLHTTQNYLPSKLTKGVVQITTIPHFYGDISLDKQTVLVLLLGFEPDRALALWKHFNPAKTIALITDPPRFGNLNYVKYARENNDYLLSQPSVEVRTVPADHPHAVRTALETVYHETKDVYNMVIGPFGTKPQVVGVFLFCQDHPKVQVVYSFPVTYTKSYMQRKPGSTMLLPVS
jgi:hypothetical protein